MKVFSQIVLLLVGIGVIYAGFEVLLQHQASEFEFWKCLLAVFQTGYHLQAIDVPYGGIVAVIVGAVMIAIAAIVARLN